MDDSLRPVCRASVHHGPEIDVGASRCEGDVDALGFILDNHDQAQGSIMGIHRGRVLHPRAYCVGRSTRERWLTARLKQSTRDVVLKQGNGKAMAKCR